MSSDLQFIARTYRQHAIQSGLIADTSRFHQCTRHCPLQTHTLLEFPPDHICFEITRPFCHHPVHQHQRLATFEQQRGVRLARFDICMVICTSSAIVHFCGARACNTRDSTPEGDTVCVLTGSILGQHEASYKPKYVISDTPGFVSRHMEHKTHDILLDEARAGSLSSMRISRNAEGGREAFRVLCIRAAHSALSEQRFKYDLEQLASETEELKRILTKYICQCNARNQIPSPVEMTIRAADFRARMGPTVILTADRLVIEFLAMHYANLIQIFWGVLRHICQPAGGQEVTKRQNFKVFACAIMELMQTGVIITTEYDRVVVLDKEPLFHIMPITKGAQRVVIGKPHNLSRIRKAILQVLNRAARELGISPQRLKVSAYRVEDFPDDVFR